MMNELRRLSTAIHPSNTPEVVSSLIYVILLLLRVVGAMDCLIGYVTTPDVVIICLQRLNRAH